MEKFKDKRKVAEPTDDVAGVPGAALECLCFPEEIPGSSGNLHSDWLPGSNKKRDAEKNRLYTCGCKKTIVIRWESSPYLTAGMVFTIRPVQVSSAAVIIRMNKFMSKCNIHFILVSHMVAADNDLIPGNRVNEWVLMYNSVLENLPLESSALSATHCMKLTPSSGINPPVALILQSLGLKNLSGTLQPAFSMASLMNLTMLSAGVSWASLGYWR